MIDCGHVREHDNGNGTLSISACWMWTDCPHQPHSEYQVWAYSPRGDNPKMLKQFRSRDDAHIFEARTCADVFSDIRRVLVYPDGRIEAR